MSAAEMASLSPDVRRRHSHTVEGDDIDDADLLHLLSDDELHLGGALSPVATRQASGIPLTQRQLFALAAYWFGTDVLLGIAWRLVVMMAYVRLGRALDASSGHCVSSGVCHVANHSV